LEAEGFEFVAVEDGDRYRFLSRAGTDFPFHPELAIAEALFQEYLEDQARHYSKESDPIPAGSRGSPRALSI
jgi:hypothetical protein